MMGSSKHLKQLLSEDQEPFVLSTFIHDKRSQLHKPIHLKRHNPIAQNSIFSANLCRNACFFAFRRSPDLAKSPLFEFSTRPKASNGLFVRIPVETAALLLEAALRIESEPKCESLKKKKIGFGLLGTLLRKIKRRKKKNESGEIKANDSLQSVCRNVSERREEVEATSLGLEVEEKRSSDVGLSCSCNSRVSSAWTESNEEKSLETSTSRSEASEEEEHETGCVIDLCETGSPFRFSLQNENECCRSPEFISPAISPQKNQVDKENEEKQTSYEDKEQKEETEFFSPISVLELEIDDVQVQDEDENDEEDDAEYERSFAFVQKAKLKLLKRLLRFERLAQLDPLELDKRITEHENEDEEEDDDDEESDGEEDDQEGGRSVLQKNDGNGVIVREVLKRSSCSNRRRIPFNMRRLDRDLMGSEGAVTLSSDRVFVADKLCKRLGSLKGVERNTIHMINKMAEIDFRGEQNQWLKNSEEVEETVVAVECAIFGFLLEDLAVELFHCDDQY